jgi:hypothetical protein
MITFLSLPTGSILMVISESENLFKIELEEIRRSYYPLFINKLGYIKGDRPFWLKLRENFKDLKISGVEQYRPGDKIIDYINTYCFTNGLPIRDVAGYEEVQASCPPHFRHPVEITMTEKMQQQFMFEGARQGINPCDIINEVLSIYISIREDIAAGKDSSKKICKFTNYISKVY